MKSGALVLSCVTKTWPKGVAFELSLGGGMEGKSGVLV